ncbi:DegT/DnrJ/EryC1/StrS family aminotransferase [Candidatus Woesearchaeota archaeon]|nr:DegT/DnrJ/EryC1/StrS family aminotransferase [Candidatus Woesearchaeota archaeon]
MPMIFGLTRQCRGIKAEIDAAISDTLEKGRFILGEKVGQFERAFAKYCRAKRSFQPAD